jgi:hypothetical protein
MQVVATIFATLKFAFKGNDYQVKQLGEKYITPISPRACQYLFLQTLFERHFANSYYPCFRPENQYLIANLF